MKILVCGGRNYKDYDKVKKVLDLFFGCFREKNNYGQFIIIHGCASGADYFASKWCASMKDFGVIEMRFPAPWSLGRPAGAMRNALMLKTSNPDRVVFYPGGSGTKNMVNLAHSSGYKLVDGEALCKSIDQKNQKGFDSSL